MIEIIFAYAKAFMVGGLICMLAQLLINYTKLTAGKILVIFLLIGVTLQAFGVYEYLVDFAGSGATVPISGFGY
jgi:stage V sporulation protein AE